MQNHFHSAQIFLTRSLWNIFFRINTWLIFQKVLLNSSLPNVHVNKQIKINYSPIWVPMQRFRSLYIFSVWFSYLLMQSNIISYSSSCRLKKVLHMKSGRRLWTSFWLLCRHVDLLSQPGSPLCKHHNRGWRLVLIDHIILNTDLLICWMFVNILKKMFLSSQNLHLFD